ncbi:hypothetical protein K402DRAFT_448677 [Aulographum hederae CBS 113979]|uniref:Uncharacterized protein n=1 Tax=Aulographum hederae CBS 113979 TaxID=1176131 RepID=A0A6G1GNP2_9PEZI|nr:hypothetical protein K402DRAFT_448677 [Aulographum hederae CBS 113979]
MRFLNTSTLKFEYVADAELDQPENRYAILSHRWGADEEEVTYDDMISMITYNDLWNLEGVGVSTKKGFAKIKGFCRYAAAVGCCYGWIDTCCINKGNSTELSEAINSMYMWYEASHICVAYLEDVPKKPFAESEWFDRGWTLQELIAPKIVGFFDQSWNLIGTKESLQKVLFDITKIPTKVLSHQAELRTCSVAQRMSWAASRKTKRVEDRAYSLMGLFDVNMSMIYGERDKAFLRLQQHILQKTKDESLFAWEMDYLVPFSGLYAPSPSCFKNCHDIILKPVTRCGSLSFIPCSLSKATTFGYQTPQP